MTKPERLQAWLLGTSLLIPLISFADTSPLVCQEVGIRVGGEEHKARIPRNYQLEVLTDKLQGPRLLTFAANGDLFIGSKSGRKREPGIVAVRFQNGEARRVDHLITGFRLADGDRRARPVGLAIGPDGALYFTSYSDAQALFRLRRR